MPELAEIMSTDVLTITEETTLLETVRMLVKHNVTGLPVVDENMRPIGIVSEKDVLEIVHNFQTREYDSNNSANTIRSIMSTDVVTFDINDSLSDICKCLMSSVFRRVPILSDGRIVGIISRKDLLEILPTSHLQ